ncbi:uncharacterized protein LOC126883173 [Diabrotica virgifera virgifera]|uniref:Uncharacterized protein n=1 Tax=Diabrotica virgifera virgifera TaxID=50390 RepID=A0ABM5K2G3_DIAVI|nr:uncharacterized protein LOC126883173 [Diabrotica virgifera virgifera]
MSNPPSSVPSDLGAHSLIVKPIKIEEKQSTKFKSTQSENKLKTTKSIKNKIVSKVRSWSNRDKYINGTTGMDAAIGKREYGEDDSEPVVNIADSNLSRARGSLENLLCDNTVNESGKYRSLSAASTSTTRNSQLSPKSSPGTSKSSKHLVWDPFGKRGPKIRKDLGRTKKRSKNVAELPKQEPFYVPMEGKSCLAKQEAKETLEDTETVEEEYGYKYKYFPKNSKSVVFTNEVFVVYFNDHDVVSEVKEPLKKDIEQVERNKEMRQGNLMRTEEKYNLCLY